MNRAMTGTSITGQQVREMDCFLLTNVLPFQKAIVAELLVEVLIGIEINLILLAYRSSAHA